MPNELLAQPVLSRRAFFGLTAVVGSLHFLGSVLGGRVTAYADDAGEPFFVVTVISPEEIGIFAVNAENTFEVIEGVHVTVYSHFNEKTVEGDTDAYGQLILNIRELSEECDRAMPFHFGFWASVEAHLDGWQEYAVGMVRLNGGPKEDQSAHVLIPTKPYNPDNGDVYLRMATIDDYDIQYFEQTCLWLKGDTGNHTMRFQIAAKAGSKVKASVLLDDKTVVAGPVEATVDSATGYGECDFAKPWPLSFVPGHTFVVQYECNGQIWERPLLYTVEDSVVQTDVPYTGDDIDFSFGSGMIWPGDDPMQLNPGGGENGGGINKNIVDLPDLPGGFALRIIADMPWMGVSVAMDSFGGLGVSLNLPTVGIYNNKKGWFDKDDYKKFWNKSYKDKCADWWGDFQEKSKDSYELYQNAKKNRDNDKAGIMPDESAQKPTQVFKSLEATFDASLYLLIYRKSSHLEAILEEQKKLGTGNALIPAADALAISNGSDFSATLKLLLCLIFTGEIGRQMIIGPVPCFASLGFYLEIDFSLQGGLQCDDGHWSFFARGGVGDEGGFLFDALFRITLTLGVGIKGIANFGFRGGVKLELIIDGTGAGDEAGKPYPHNTLVFGGFVEVFFQLLFATKSFKFFDRTIFDIWNNWPEDLPNSAGKMLPEDRATWVSDALHRDSDDWQFTTNDMLLASIHADGAELIRARANEQGVICDYDCSVPDKRVVELNRKVSASRGIRNPFYGGGKDLFDPRRGQKSDVDDPLAQGVFSDTHIRVVDLGDNSNIVYNCRLAMVDMNVSPSYAQVYKKNGQYIAVPRTNEEGKYANAPVCGDDGKITVPAYGKASMHKGGSETEPAVAELFVERYEGDTPEDVAERTKKLMRFLDGSGNARFAAAGTPVNVEELPRVRLTVTPHYLDTGEFGEMDVVDFVIPSESAETVRTNLHDVEFLAASEKTAEGKTVMRIGLTSYFNSFDPWLPTEGQLDNMFTTTLRYDPNAEKGNRVSDVHANIVDLSQNGEYDWAAHPTAIQRLDGGSTLGGPNSEVSMRDCACLVSNGSRVDASGNAKNVLVLRTYPIDSRGELETNCCIAEVPDGFVMDDYGILTVFASSTLKSEGNSDAVALAWQLRDKGPDEEGKNQERTMLWTADGKTGELLAQWDFTDTHGMTVFGDEKGLIYMRPTGENERWNLERAYFKSPTELVYDEVMGTFNTAVFTPSETGDFLFCAHLTEAGSEENDYSDELIKTAQRTDINFATNTSPYTLERGGLAEYRRPDCLYGEAPEGLYQVMCSRWDPYKKVFHPFFAYGMLDNAPTESAVFQHSRGVSFMYSTITDVTNQVANIYFKMLERTASAEVDDVVCFDAFVGNKTDGTPTIVHPVVKITNTGTDPLNRIVLVFNEIDEDGTLLDYTYTVDMTRLQDYVREPMDAASDITGEAVAAKAENHTANGVTWEREHECTLWPSETRDYIVPIEVPNDWEHKAHLISVRISDFEVDDFKNAPAGLFQMSQDNVAGKLLSNDEDMVSKEYLKSNNDGIIVCIDPRHHRVTMGQPEESRMYVPELKHASAKKVSGKGDSGKGSPGKRSSGRSDSLANTGDGSVAGIAAAAALAAGALGAGAAALHHGTVSDESDGE